MTIPPTDDNRLTLRRRSFGAVGNETAVADFYGEVDARLGPNKMVEQHLPGAEAPGGADDQYSSASMTVRTRLRSTRRLRYAFQRKFLFLCSIFSFGGNAGAIAYNNRG